MPLTISTIENVTTVTGTGGPTAIFTPSPAEQGRYKLRVVRFMLTGTVVAGEGCTITGTTTNPAGGTETQTLWSSLAVAGAAFIDQTSFPDEAEFRGKIQVTITSAAGVALLILYHG